MTPGKPIIFWIFLQQLFKSRCLVIDEYDHSGRTPYYAAAITTIIGVLCYLLLYDSQNGRQYIHCSTSSTHLYNPNWYGLFLFLFISICWDLLFLLQLHFLDLYPFPFLLSNPPYFPFYWPLLLRQLLILLLCLFFVALPTLILYMIGKVLYYKILFIVTI